METAQRVPNLVSILPWTNSDLRGMAMTPRSLSPIASPVMGFLIALSLLTGCQVTLSPPGRQSTPVARAPSTASPASVPAGATTASTATPTGSASAKVLASPVDPIPLSGTGAGVIADVAATVRPGVVQITNEQLTLDQLNQGTLVPQGVGSGIIFDAAGHILTNNHVVAGAKELQVSLPDGRTFPATLVGRDPRSDLAVIQVQGTNLPVIPLGDSAKLVVGQWVVAIGNALALEGGPTVTAGVVSALGRTVQEPGDATTNAPGPFLFDAIQTDAPINPGNSGGPLVNLQGEVIGINTLGVVQAEPGVPAQSVGFAIAIDTAKPIADEIVKSGHVTYAYLGVSVYPNSPAIAVRFNLPNQPGMIVTDLDPAGPAAHAGVKADDVIVSADSHKLSDPSELYRVLQAHKPGDKISISVARGSQSQTMSVTLGTAPATP